MLRILAASRTLRVPSFTKKTSYCKRGMTMAESPVLDEVAAVWTEKQLQIAERVNYEDENDWSSFFTADGYKATKDLFIAGADISFSTTQAGFSVGTLTITKLFKDGTTDLVYSQSQRVSMPHPYVPSFLGFRESPIISELLAGLPTGVRESIDCLLVDGNGVLHPRKAGLACQVGVEEDLPCVGVSKALLCVDGLDEKEVRGLATSAESEAVDVVGASGFVWAKAIMTGNARSKPIYVSVGHRVSLETCARLVLCLCEYRIPNPIRFADMHSRALVRGEKIDIHKSEAFLYTGH